MLSFLFTASPLGIFLGFVLLSLMTIGLWAFYYTFASRIMAFYERAGKKDVFAPLPSIRVMTLLLCGAAVAGILVMLCTCAVALVKWYHESPAFASFKQENLAGMAGLLLLFASLFGVNYYFYRKHYPKEKITKNADKPDAQREPK